MRRDPRTLSDEALIVALAIAQAVAEHDGRTSATVAELETEQIERLYARPAAEVRA